MITNTCKDLMKQFVKNLISGKISDAMRMRTPAFIHCPKSYLDCMMYEFSYLEGMLLLLNDRELIDNPLERIKYITTAYLAGIHVGVLNQGLKAPLNPILGETSVK